MASIMKRGDSYSVRYKYKDHSGKPCEGWESFKTRKEAQERKITVEKELLDGTFLVPDTMTVEEMLYKWIPIQSTKAQMVSQDLHPICGDGAEPYRAVYRETEGAGTANLRHREVLCYPCQDPCGQYVHGVKQS